MDVDREHDARCSRQIGAKLAQGLDTGLRRASAAHLHTTSSCQYMYAALEKQCTLGRKTPLLLNSVTRTFGLLWPHYDSFPHADSCYKSIVSSSTYCRHLSTNLKRDQYFNGFYRSSKPPLHPCRRYGWLWKSRLWLLFLQLRARDM